MGATILELIVSVAIFAAVGVVLVAIFVSSTGLQYNQSSKVQQGLGSNDALARFKLSLKEAQSVAASYPEIGPSMYTTGAAQLVLKLPVVDANGNLQSDAFDYAVYYTSAQGGNNQLHYKVILHAASQRQAVDIILSSNVNSVNFQYFDVSGTEVSPPVAAKVRLTLTLSQKIGVNVSSSAATAEANLRNN